MALAIGCHASAILLPSGPSTREAGGTLGGRRRGCLGGQIIEDPPGVLQEQAPAGSAPGGGEGQEQARTHPPPVLIHDPGDHRQGRILVGERAWFLLVPCEPNEAIERPNLKRREAFGDAWFDHAT
ncbi:MAG: hypothetical protein IPK69_11745 [Phycisphaerales bacterium]|nr:MAG: hypothetical protein IPK69_11745 [Phycisphaerales bacterium]